MIPKYSKQIDLVSTLAGGKLTQSDLAHKMMISRQQVNEWATGKVVPGRFWATEILKFFNRRGITVVYK